MMSYTKNFWQTLKRPITVLAPMEDVTDAVFRQIVRLASNLQSSPEIDQIVTATLNNQNLPNINLVHNPDVVFTEFTSCEGVQSIAQAKVIHRLKYDSLERPIVAQIWGVTPEDYYKTAQLIQGLGFDGIDINMGCPVKNVIRQGACSALIKNPNLAKEIIRATHEGCEYSLPVSVKTRIGFSAIQTEEWCGFLLENNQLAALTVHGRTVKEESKVPNHWDEIGKVAKINKAQDFSKNSDTSEKLQLMRKFWIRELQDQIVSN